MCMSTLDHTLVVAVDGGGTRCRVAAFVDGQVISVETGSANVSTDFDGAVRQMVEGIGALAARVGCADSALWAAPAFVGLAGVTGPEMEQRLRAALGFAHVRIADDRLAAVRGVLGGRDGALAHCGTGSFYALQVEGAAQLAGGWGSVLGDEASAQWVGRLALSLTLEVVDGRRSPAPLADLLLGKFADAAGIVRFAGTARPSEFGALARLVTTGSAQGDDLARAILQRGANEISTALRQMGWRPEMALCLTGGIGPEYAAYLPDDMRARLAETAGQPLDGAIALALDFAREIAHERH